MAETGRSRDADPRVLVERPLPRDGQLRSNVTEPNRPGRATRLARSVTVNVKESPLSWLHARGHISPSHYDAGEALRRDYELSQLSPRTTMQWDTPPPSKVARNAPIGLSPSEAQLAAKRRFDDAMRILGSGLDDIAWRVLCAGEGLKGAERAMGWPSRSGKIVLLLALDRLADHYRLPG